MDVDNDNGNKEVSMSIEETNKYAQRFLSLCLSVTCRMLVIHFLSNLLQNAGFFGITTIENRKYIGER